MDLIEKGGILVPNRVKTPRTFAALRGVMHPDFGVVYLALGNDGTAWAMLDATGWRQLPALPARED